MSTAPRSVSEAGADCLLFGAGGGDIARVTPDEVGQKAFNLLRMARRGLPVPPGFVLGTAYCRRYYDRGRRAPDELRELLGAMIRRLEIATGRSFGGYRLPLVVSVRSAAAQSMPGMLETVLNVGLTRETVPALIRATGNPRLAWDCYRRLLEQFATVVFGGRKEPFARLAAERAAADGVAGVSELDTDSLRLLCDELERAIATLCGAPFPSDPTTQLEMAVEAVWRSWSGVKAREYRRLNGLDDGAGTAVVVQAMVFGNAGGTSGSGVAFTRDPASGENALYMDFLFNAQGEDVVSGRYPAHGADGLKRVLPKVFTEIEQCKRILEREFLDMQDLEFTVEDGRLYLLQTRPGKRAPWAALQIAVDLVAEGVIPAEEALRRIEGLDLERIERARLCPGAADAPLSRGIPASTGTAVGRVALSAERTHALAAQGRAVILVRDEAATDDIAAIALAQGIATVAGARTSHAAVVARQLGKVCIVGCRELRIDAANRRITAGGHTIAEGDAISLDGEAGTIYLGEVPTVRERPTQTLEALARLRAGVSVAG